MIQRARQYILDSYNGLYKIVLKPSMPTKQTIILLLVGLLLGMIWAYGLSPTIFYDAQPSQLSDFWRQEWVKLVAGSKEGLRYTDEDIVSLLQQIENPAATIQTLLANTDGALNARLQEIQDLANAAQPGKTAPRNAGFVSSLFSFLVPLIIITILTPILVLIWRLLFYPNIVAPLWDRIRPKSEEELKKKAELQVEKAARLAAIEAQKNLVVQMDEELGEPLIQKLSIYTKGRQYDESFAIETPSDEFLGECGAAIGKTIGETNELTAVEVWLFDKEDFVRTLTKIFVSEYAYNNPAIRSELETKVENPATDLMVIKEDAQLTLETDALRVQAKVKNFAYGTSPLPPNSHFDSMQIEIAAWQKQKDGVKAAAPMATPAAYNPPPAPPTQAPPAYSPPQPAPSYPPPQAQPPGGTQGGIRPLTPPPLQPRPSQQPKQDDDPFGGTGDFTPISNS